MVHAFAEAVALMLPREAGGRLRPVSPRDGSYQPFARTPGGDLLRIRMIEGPPTLAPGEQAIVMVEFDGAIDVRVLEGTELSLLEHDDAPIGYVSVLRVWIEAVAS